MKIKHIDTSKAINDKNQKIKIGDTIRISKCFCKMLQLKLV